MSTGDSADRDWDVFVSYASEDRDALARPLVALLEGIGLSVWWDQFELRLGDSLTTKISAGLARSKFGVIIVTPAFLAKRWTEYELRGLTAREITGTKVILPLTYDVTFDELLTVNPTLAEKKAYSISSDERERGIIRAALEIVQEVRPDRLTALHRRIAYERMVREATVEEQSVEEVNPSPPRHESLPDDLLVRIRLVRAALMWVYPRSFEFWVSGFVRDLNPSREVALWERIACAALEFMQYGAAPDSENLKAAFNFLLAISTGVDPEVVELPEKMEEYRILLANLYASAEPLIEWTGCDPVDAWGDSDEGGPPSANLMREDFGLSLTSEQVAAIVEFYEDNQKP